MGQPAAKKGDIIRGTDNHRVKFPNGAVAVLPLPFQAIISDNVSPNVRIMRAEAAMEGSLGKNAPEHLLALRALAPVADFVIQPNNEGKIAKGSATVRINGKPAARNDDDADTCHDVQGAPSKVVAIGTVMIG